MTSGNGHSAVPPEIVELHFPPIADAFPPPPRPARAWLPVLLFFLTVLSTLAVGVEFARAYAAGEPPFSSTTNLFATMVLPFRHIGLLALGVPFSFTLLTILMAHELGHYFACRVYHIDASLPIFIPAPTLFGTFGAFIRIRSRIPTRRALFDVGFAGPLAGFVFSVPALAYGIAHAKVIPGGAPSGSLQFGAPLLERGLLALIRPDLAPENMLLHPVGFAAWVGLFVTALNLLPAWQLDGGHILYGVASHLHRRISILVGAVTLAWGIYVQGVWILWGALILIFSMRYRHPPLRDPWEPLDANRRLWAMVAAVIFLICFTPRPVVEQLETSQARLAGSTSTITAVSGISRWAQNSETRLSAVANIARLGVFSRNWKRYS